MRTAASLIAFVVFLPLRRSACSSIASSPVITIARPAFAQSAKMSRCSTIESAREYAK